MLHKSFQTVAGVMVLFALIAFIGCSGEDDSLKPSVINDVAQQITDSIVESVVAGATAEDIKPEPEFTATDDIEVDNFNDLVIVDSTIYAVFNGGLLVYNLTDDTYKTIGCGEDLNAVVLHQNEIYAGGKNLFKVIDAELGKVTVGENGLFKPINPALESVVLHYESGITDLESFGSALIIGTGDGLYSKSGNEIQTLREDIAVTALTNDDEGLWVGTDGDGLFHYQNDKFHKRFLIRDSSIFDYVNCLDYNRGYVYAGTDDALYIFDGGKWETLTTDDGLPSNCIKSVNADGWVIYVGTDQGVISYFNGDFLPVKNMDNAVANAFGRVDSKMIAGTNDALLFKSRQGVRTLVESDLIDTRQPMLVEDTIDNAAPDMKEITGPFPALVDPVDEPEDSFDLDSVIRGKETIKNILTMAEDSGTTGKAGESAEAEIVLEEADALVSNEESEMKQTEPVKDGGEDNNLQEPSDE